MSLCRPKRPPGEVAARVASPSPTKTRTSTQRQPPVPGVRAAGRRAAGRSRRRGRRAAGARVVAPRRARSAVPSKQRHEADRHATRQSAPAAMPHGSSSAGSPRHRERRPARPDTIPRRCSAHAPSGKRHREVLDERRPAAPRRSDRRRRRSRSGAADDQPRARTGIATAAVASLAGSTGAVPVTAAAPAQRARTRAARARSAPACGRSAARAAG